MTGCVRTDEPSAAGTTGPLMRNRLIGRCAVCYETDLAFGPLAQLGERLVHNQLLALVRTSDHSDD
jgi:hypothetical protein